MIAPIHAPPRAPAVFTIVTIGAIGPHKGSRVIAGLARRRDGAGPAAALRHHRLFRHRRRDGRGRRQPRPGRYETSDEAFAHLVAAEPLRDPAAVDLARNLLLHALDGIRVWLPADRVRTSAHRPRARPGEGRRPRAAHRASSTTSARSTIASWIICAGDDHLDVDLARPRQHYEAEARVEPRGVDIVGRHAQMQGHGGCPRAGDDVREKPCAHAAPTPRGGDRGCRPGSRPRRPLVDDDAAPPASRPTSTMSCRAPG